MSLFRLFAATRGSSAALNSVETGSSVTGFMKTAVPGIWGIPGGSWGKTPGSLDGTWDYYVPHGQAMRKEDTSHMGEDCASLTKYPEPQLALPWGFLVQDGEAATLVDVPYYSPDLVEKIKDAAPTGLTHILFTHKDFIGMAEPAKWRKAFPSVTRVGHSADVKDEMDIFLEGAGPWQVGDFRIDSVPGHTAGSVIISSESLSTSFAGDSMGFWEGKPTGYGMFAQFSCMEQAESLRRFADEAPFYEFWFPGHGLPMRFEDLNDRREQLYKAAADLESDSRHARAP